MKILSSKVLVLIGFFILCQATAQAQFTPAPTSGIRMSFTTKKAVGEKVKVLIHSVEQKGVWIDLNGDATYQSGEEVTNFDEDYHEYTLGAQTINIYGNTTRLGCKNEQVTSVDVTNNPELTYLSCGKNELTSLDLTKNGKLLRVFCDDNQLTNIDLSGNPKLIILCCNRNNIEKLDLTQSPKLATLWCANNKLTELNTSTNPRLNDLWCFGNKLTTIDLSANDLLNNLWCSNNQLEEMNLSNCTSLAYVQCESNKLKSLKFPEVRDLNLLICHSNQIKGEEMTKLVNSIPTLSGNSSDPTFGQFVVIDTKNSNEGNICTTTDVEIATDKNWHVFDFNGDAQNMIAYEGTTSNLQIYNSAFRLYPNPVNQYVEIQVSETLVQETAILYDLNGKEVLRFKVEAPQQRIDLSSLSAGTYLLQIDDYTAKLIKR